MAKSILSNIPRRTVLKASGALAAAAWLTPLAWAGERSALPQLFFYEPAADPTGGLLQTLGRGLDILAVERDVGATAMTLDRRWWGRPFAVIGLTGATGLFIVERLALRHGMCLLARQNNNTAGSARASITWAIGYRLITRET